MATTVTMNTRATTLDLAMRQIIRTTVKRLTMFSAIPSHTMDTRVGASGDKEALTEALLTSVIGAVDHDEAVVHVGGNRRSAITRVSLSSEPRVAANRR